VDESIHAAAAGANVAEQALRFLRQLARIVIEHDLRISLDRPQRRPQIRVRRSEKMRRVLVGGFELSRACLDACSIRSMSSADSSAAAAVLAKMVKALKLAGGGYLLYVASSEAQHADEPTTGKHGQRDAQGDFREAGDRGRQELLAVTLAQLLAREGQPLRDGGLYRDAPVEQRFRFGPARRGDPQDLPRLINSSTQTSAASRRRKAASMIFS